MIKSPKPRKRALSIEDTLPWSCTHYGNYSEIEANVNNEWPTVAVVDSVGSFAAKDIAKYIVRSVNKKAE